jgi:hypothetical protein
LTLSAATGPAAKDRPDGLIRLSGRAPGPAPSIIMPPGHPHTRVGPRAEISLAAPLRSPDRPPPPSTPPASTAPAASLRNTGTRGLLGATLGSAADRDETGLGRRLLHLLGPGMLVLLDRGFDGNSFLAQVLATGAVLLARAKCTRTPLVLAHLPDGSYLSRLDGLDVRTVDADVAMTGNDGTRIADSYRLITTLTDHRAYPALSLVRLYHERCGAT